MRALAIVSLTLAACTPTRTERAQPGQPPDDEAIVVTYYYLKF